MTTAESVFEELRKRKLKISCGESFTGGGIASKLVSMAGASEILSFSAVCYSNEAKNKVLGVPLEVIDRFGAVSNETVDKMLDGLRDIGLSDVQVATSGNAGPTSEKPDEVGVAYIGVSYGKNRFISRMKFDGDRHDVIEAGIEAALKLVMKILQRK